jgi:hypothetical protein
VSWVRLRTRATEFVVCCTRRWAFLPAPQPTARSWKALKGNKRSRVRSGSQYSSYSKWYRHPWWHFCKFIRIPTDYQLSSPVRMMETNSVLQVNWRQTLFCIARVFPNPSPKVQFSVTLTSTNCPLQIRLPSWIQLPLLQSKGNCTACSNIPTRLQSMFQ